MKPRKLKIKELASNSALNLALDTIRMDKQALVFANSKKSAERTAEDIALKVKNTSAELHDLSEKALKCLSAPTKQCKRLAMCLKKGIAFHHAGLHPKQKALVEDNFRTGIVKIIACTPTLAAGLDLPAFRTILKDLRRYTGNFGMQYIPVLEYLQMAGRAGRPGKEEYGESIIIAGTQPDREELFGRYICGVPEDIYSKLAVEPVLRTYILSLIATRFVNDRKSIIEFFSKTFWAQQFEDMPRLEEIIDKMLHLLDNYEFIRMKNDDFMSADEVSDGKIVATALGKRVAELYIDPLTAFKIIEALRKASSGKVSDFAFIHLICSTNEIRPWLRTRTREFDEIQEKLAEQELLVDEPSLYDSEYSMFIDGFKTALFMKEWTDEKTEEFLLENFDIRPGEIKAKLDIADWLIYSSIELARILQFRAHVTKLNRIRIRIKYGVREEILPLLRLRNIGRARARKMFNAGIKNLGDVKKIDIFILSRLIGKKIALDVKDQVGQKIDAKKVPSTSIDESQTRL